MTNHKKASARSLLVSAAIALAVSLLVLFLPSLHAQVGGDMEKRVAELKESSVKNKQALAQYAWIEQVTIFLKGEERKSETFRVHEGPDGKPVKTPLDPGAAQAPKG